MPRFSGKQYQALKYHIMGQSYAFLRYLSTVSDRTATDKIIMFEIPLIFEFRILGLRSGENFWAMAVLP